ncbi:MAG: uroporphyrinogen-III C-methyltransferase [Elainellaceae cyanobacterium]
MSCAPEAGDAPPSGRVYLLGAGPGGVQYLTLQAHQILQRADVLVYDALVDEALLDLVPRECDRRHVGKRGGQPSTPQAEINQLLVSLAHQGQRVVRLKSGDPFIFGRCAAEIEALRQAGCPFQVVPGLSSALVAPLLAHIPLTDPVLSQGFAVVTGHEPAQLNWEALSALETLVILMGTRQLPAIVEQLQTHGRSPSTPIAIIRWAGQPQQQLWLGTLENILQKTSRQPLSPAIIVIGEVVRLRDYLQPLFESSS